MPNFWFKFEWDAWRNDKQLRRCSKETRGFWIDCIAVMEEQETYFLEGTPAEICRDVVADRGEFDRSIAELSRHGAATIEDCQGVVKIVSRRLLKKISLTEYNRLKQQEHRAKQMSIDGQDPPSKDKSFRALDSPIGEAQDAAADTEPKPVKPEPKILLPTAFSISEEMRAWARNKAPDIDIDGQLEEFISFWVDIATKNNKRTMRGWIATWKKRMRDLQEAYIPPRNGHRPKADIGKYEPELDSQPDFKCGRCFDTKEVLHFPKEGSIEGSGYIPCPDCIPVQEKAAA